MKKSLPILFVLSIFFLLFLAACGGRSEASAEVNVEATVSAMLAATAEFEEAVAVAVGDLPTPEPAPTETVEYVAMSEEELALLIEETVDAAVTATETYATTTTTATSDGEVTAQEVETIEVYVYGAEEAVAYAEELIDYYYAVYGDLAETAVSELSEIEDDLAAIATSTEAMVAELDEINETLAAGLELAEETIVQLEDAAETAVSTANDAVGQAQLWADSVQQEVASRTEMVESMIPTEIATSQEELIAQLTGYATEVSGALNDGSLSQTELTSIAQSSANTVASMNTSGNAAIQEMAGSVEALTQQLAKGDFQAAITSLSSLQAGLPEIGATLGAGFSLPAAPGGNISLPSRPSRP